MIGPIDVEVVQALAAWLPETARGAGLPVTATATAPQDLVASAHDLLQVSSTGGSTGRSPGGGSAAVLLQGAVTLADHLSSAQRHLAPSPADGAGFATLLATVVSPFHKHQISAAEVPYHLLLRAPTGSGKTEAGLLWAARQVEAVATATGGTPGCSSPCRTSPRSTPWRAGSARCSVIRPRSASPTPARPPTIWPRHQLRRRRTGDSRPQSGRTCSATRLFRETVRVATPYQLLRGMLAGPAHSASC